MEKLCVVKRKENGSGKVINILLWVFAVLALAGVVLLGIWPLVLVAIGSVVAFFVGGFALPVCYDYTFFGTEMRIAKIKGDNRRKLLHEINMENVEAITGEDDPILFNYEKISGVIRKDYTSGLGVNKVYKMIFKDGKQICILDIEPSPEFIDALAEKYGRIIKK